MRYVLNTPAERREMLARIGAGDIQELFDDIPPAIRLGHPLNLPRPMAEPELYRHLGEMSSANQNLDGFACFLGAGAYDHYVPQVIVPG
jgi:glycine dehydrogenase subunit 1